MFSPCEVGFFWLMAGAQVRVYGFNAWLVWYLFIR